MPVDAMAFLRPYKRLDVPSSKPGSPSKPRASPNAGRSARKPAAEEDSNDEELLRRPPPQGAYTDFVLMSSGGQEGMVFDIMKFDSRKPVGFENWTQPLKLNRKNPPPRESDDAPKPGKITPMLGADGNLVIGPDGNVVMMQDGRPIMPKKEEPVDEDGEDVKPATTKDGKDGQPKKRRPFQKKTKQIFTIPEERRQRLREERFPWLLEDASGSEMWTGRLDGADKGDMHGMFVLYPGDNNFYFLPTHRWYKLQKRQNIKVLDHEEVEAKFAAQQKNQSTDFWRERNNKARQQVEAAMAAGQEVNLGHIQHQPSLVRMSGPTSQVIGGKRLRTVVKAEDDDDLFGDDDEELRDTLRKRRDAELGEEGDLDEVEHEEDFSDDEETMKVDDVEDLETKEAEERIKRESRRANKLREAGIDEDDDDAIELLEMLTGQKLTGAGKGIRKALRTHEKTGDDSDDDEDPYLTPDEEEEEEPVAQPTGLDKTSTVKPKPRPTPTTSSSSKQLGKNSARPGNGASRTGSRANSPPVPHGAGNMAYAQRATSPKGKNVPGSSRANSPPGRPGGPVRATSPLAGGSGTRAVSPSAGQKRKLDSANGQPQAKRPRQEPTASGSSSGNGGGASGLTEINDALVINYLRSLPSPPRTSDCINYFRRFLNRDDDRKKQLAAIIKRVAELKNGYLLLRE